MSTPRLSPALSDFLPIVLSAETAILMPWQKHCHGLAVELIESLDGWTAAAHYLRKGEPAGFGGLFDIPRGPYPSRESAIRNTIAHLVHHMLKMGLTIKEAERIYRASGVPIPPRWPNAPAQR